MRCAPLQHRQTLSQQALHAATRQGTPQVDAWRCQHMTDSLISAAADVRRLVDFFAALSTDEHVRTRDTAAKATRTLR